MGDDHQGGAGAAELLDHVEHLADEFGVEGGSRLVEQQHLGPQSQCPGDGDALLLAAGELARIGVGLVGETDPGQQVARLGDRLRPGQAADGDRRLDDVLDHREVREQVEALKNHADIDRGEPGCHSP